MEDEIFENTNVRENESAIFDAISSEDFYYLLKYMNSKYRASFNRCKTSGCHDDFDHYIGNMPWIHFYPVKLQECGVELNTLETTEIPCDLFRSSIRKEKTVETPPSDTKEKRSLAIDSICSFPDTSQKKVLIYEEWTQLMRVSEREQQSYKIKIHSEYVLQIGNVVDKLRGCNKDLHWL